MKCDKIELISHNDVIKENACVKEKEVYQMSQNEKWSTTLQALFATENGHLNFAKTSAASNFKGNDTVDELIILNSISTVILAKSSDVSEKHPAANNDAFTCKNPIQYFTYIY